ncbi:MAG: phosphopantetheine-binding protein [Pseudoclavibacter sp.]|nr:phosphopantetheine-binding protein [Pseudoclavibacter sp.]
MERDARAWLRERLGELIGEEAAAVGGGEDLREHGLDSVRAFQLATLLRRERPGLEFADIAERLTVDGLAELLEG